MTRKRMLWLVAAVLLLVAAIDFRQRVYVPREHKARGEGSMVPAAVATPQTPEQIRTNLSAWLPQLRPVAAGNGPAAQTDWALTLLAVFADRDKSFAVVRATSSAGGAAKIQRVATGDSVYGLTVARIEPLKLVLTGERGEQELQLFKPSATSAVGSGSSAQVAALPPARAAAARPATGAAPTQAQVQAPVAAPAGSAKAANGEGWKPGAPGQLPESMRGLKVVEAPVPTTKPKIRKRRKAQSAPQPPKNP